MAQVMEGVANFLSYFLIGGSLARFTVSGSKLARFFVTNFPVSEKTRSEGTDVPGMKRKNFEIGAKFL